MVKNNLKTNGTFLLMLLSLCANAEGFPNYNALNSVLKVQTTTPVVQALKAPPGIAIPVSTEGVNYNNTISISYLGGNGSDFQDITIYSTGVTGLTAKLSAGKIANGSGILPLVVSGTPSTSGTASFILNFGGKTISFNIQVNSQNGSGPLVQGLTAPTNIAGATQGSYYQHNIPLTYYGGNGKDYQEVAVASTGVAGLTAKLNSAKLLNGTGALMVMISGTPSASGIAKFTFNFGGKSVSFNVNVSPAAAVSPIVQSLSAPTIIPAAAEGNYYSKLNSIGYTGGNGADYQGITVSSTGVSGLTARLNPGKLTNGNGYLGISIFGIPQSSGIANFIFELGGKSISFNVNVTKSVKIFPIPFTNVLNISDAAAVRTLTIKDSQGQLVKSITNPTSTVDVGSLLSGTYYITLELFEGNRINLNAIKL